MLDGNLSLYTYIKHVIRHPYDRSISHILVLLWTLFLNVNLLIRRFCTQSLYYINSNCQTVYGSFYHKKTNIFLTNRYVKRDTVEHVLLVNYTNLSYKPMTLQSVHHLVYKSTRMLNIELRSLRMTAVWLNLQA